MATSSPQNPLHSATFTLPWLDNSHNFRDLIRFIQGARKVKFSFEKDPFTFDPVSLAEIRQAAAQRVPNLFIELVPPRGLALNPGHPWICSSTFFSLRYRTFTGGTRPSTNQGGFARQKARTKQVFRRVPEIIWAFMSGPSRELLVWGAREVFEVGVD
ncbi:hypothetical protein DL96DRAFT_1688816 [Flagelloscypha sp. PMI_526]|nr:hypothetical protein DL96DRAFT_1688816 [Flagelloscypha sp. PMI_526]